jgi:anti-sigma-K factor RskA
MTSQEARELFSAAYDTELDAEAARGFEQALANDANLASEYAEFRSLLAAAAEDVEVAKAPDLLPGVQHRLRTRSRGRFYRDRFSERAGLGARSPLIVAGVMMLLAALVWLALRVVQAIAV